MNRPQSIPANYIETEPGVWVHPSRLPHTALKDAIGACEIHKQAANLRVAQVVPKPQKRIRQSTKPLLNKLEQKYWGYLTAIYVDHPIISQGLNFRLANGCWYCPDFVVWADENNDTRAFEVKGNQPIQDDSVVKIKVAAKEYYWIRWYLVWWKDNQWQTQLVIP